MTDLLILFAKAPEAGRVKTRMTPFLSEAAAAELQRALVLDTLQLTDSLPLQRAVACLPAIDHPFFLQCGRERRLLFFQQQGATLGDRMKAAFEWGFSRGFQKVLLLGCDTPNLPPRLIEEAISRLPSFALVLGPSIDGGYYLIGARPPVPDLFDGIAWGTDTVLSATLGKVAKQEIRGHLLPFWYDIDRPADLAFLKAHLGLLEGQGTTAAKETRCVIERWERGAG